MPAWADASVSRAGLGGKVEEVEGVGPANAIGLLVLSLAMIVVGTELLVHGAKGMIIGVGLSETLIGMTLSALAISIERLVREFPAALRGHPEISFGNVAGSVLTFFLLNAGIIALLRPLPVDAATVTFYLPVAAGTVVLISALLLFRHVPRWPGVLPLAVYIGFAFGGYLLFGASPEAG